MAKVFKAINHLATSFLPREHGYVLTTAKRPVGQPRKRKPSAEAPPVPSIDCASKILPSLSDSVSQEAKQISHFSYLLLACCCYEMMERDSSWLAEFVPLGLRQLVSLDTTLDVPVV